LENVEVRTLIRFDEPFRMLTDRELLKLRSAAGIGHARREDILKTG
jgi:hypothetical protein